MATTSSENLEDMVSILKKMELLMFNIYHCSSGMMKRNKELVTKLEAKSESEDKIGNETCLISICNAIFEVVEESLSELDSACTSIKDYEEILKSLTSVELGEISSLLMLTESAGQACAELIECNNSIKNRIAKVKDTLQNSIEQSNTFNVSSVEEQSKEPAL